MIKDEIRQVLATYSPPLSSSQIDQIAETIAEMSATEIESLKKEPIQTRKTRR
jgi:uncharacterized protein YdcH (DUF465 family)